MAVGWIEVGGAMINLDLVRGIEWIPTGGLKLIFDPSHSHSIFDDKKRLIALRARILAGLPATPLVERDPTDVEGGPDEGPDWWARAPQS